MNDVEIVVIYKQSDVKHGLQFSPMLSQDDDTFSTFVHSLRPIMSDVESGIAIAGFSAERPEIRESMDELRRYFVAYAPAELAEEFVQRINNDPRVETAYSKPAVKNPLGPKGLEIQQEYIEANQIPDFKHLQGYLGNAPGGIDVESAWAMPGGRGTSVRVVDIEGGWQLSHIDLPYKNGGLIGGRPYPEEYWTNHGTAVLGQIGGDENAFGVTGISPDAVLSVLSHGGLGSAKAIQLAAQKLQPGDVLLLEMHRPGPRYNYEDTYGQEGFICVEWWPDDFQAIKYATLKGITVIEAAGNGAENLDDPIYDIPHPKFPANWKNPFVGAQDSGAIVVGAGAPPSGNHGLDRSRLDFSNYGARVDCQAWGREVVTLGYGDLFKLAGMPQHEDYWYTGQFSGTSSASPIVAGAVACLQGIAKNRGKALAPTTLRDALRTTGSSQQSNTMERIGNRPDLRQLIAHLFQ